MYGDDPTWDPTPPDEPSQPWSPGPPDTPYQPPRDAQEFLGTTPNKVSDADLMTAIEKAEMNGFPEIAAELRSEVNIRNAAANEFAEPVSPGTSSGSPVQQIPMYDVTRAALDEIDSDDYSQRCKHCKARPVAEGPHHDSNCSRHQTVLSYSSDLAHLGKCRHCGAQSYVAGPHHTRDCPRRVKFHLKTLNVNQGYTNKCKHCGVKPFSQGPHHKKSCKRHFSYYALSTDVAHRYRCKHCQARPFIAGPHHHEDCGRNVIPVLNAWEDSR